MNVDRTRFLLFAAALAAGAATAACSTTNNGASDGGPTSDATTPSDAATSDATGGDAQPSDGGGGTDAAKDSAPACDDTAVDGGVIDCNVALGPDAGLDAGCGSDPRANGFCSAIEKNVKPRLAREAIDCFVGPACEGVAGCIGTALSGACPDPTATTYCQGLAAACDDAGVAEAGVGAVDAGDFQSACEQVAAGMTADGRTAFQNCYVASTGCTDLTFCFGDLAQ